MMTIKLNSENLACSRVAPRRSFVADVYSSL
jgi:hypothetical protein